MNGLTPLITLLIIIKGFAIINPLSHKHTVSSSRGRSYSSGLFMSSSASRHESLYIGGIECQETNRG